VICGRTIEAERTLKKAFEHHRMRKTYLAIVRGVPEHDSGDIALPMAPVKEGLHVLMEVCSEGGLDAHTHYRVRQRAREHALLELFPKSGRQHQLRVHLSAIGHPIVGDKLYGPEREAPFMEYIETGMTPELEERVGHTRHALHAHTLTFTHPSRMEEQTVVADLSPDLRALWDRLCAL
jgi:23S rRNA pseudouridine1911/1915/1917 synthase